MTLPTPNSVILKEEDHLRFSASPGLVYPLWIAPRKQFGVLNGALFPKILEHNPKRHVAWGQIPRWRHTNHRQLGHAKHGKQKRRTVFRFACQSLSRRCLPCSSGYKTTFDWMGLYPKKSPRRRFLGDQRTSF